MSLNGWFSLIHLSTCDRVRTVKQLDNFSSQSLGFFTWTAATTRLDKAWQARTWLSWRTAKATSTIESSACKQDWSTRTNLFGVAILRRSRNQSRRKGMNQGILMIGSATCKYCNWRLTLAQWIELGGFCRPHFVVHICILVQCGEHVFPIQCESFTSLVSRWNNVRCFRYVIGCIQIH